MNLRGTLVIREESWRFGNLHDNDTTILKRLKHSGRIVVDCGRGLNRSSTVAKSASFQENITMYLFNKLDSIAEQASMSNI